MALKKLFKSHVIVRNYVINDVLWRIKGVRLLFFITQLNIHVQYILGTNKPISGLSVRRIIQSHWSVSKSDKMVMFFDLSFELFKKVVKHSVFLFQNVIFLILGVIERIDPDISISMNIDSWNDIWIALNVIFYVSCFGFWERLLSSIVISTWIRGATCFIQSELKVIVSI